jgi:hypothetical protein
MSWRLNRAAGLWAVGLSTVVALLVLPAQGQVEKSHLVVSRAASSVLKESSSERSEGKKSLGKESTVIESSGRVEQIASDDQPAEREIDDPATGDRWILMRDAAHPEGPGRMALISPQRTESRFGSARGAGTANVTFSTPVLVIHGGDKVTVEEHTPVVDARLEAVALGAAAQGNPFRVRLTIGGEVILAVATAPGHAVVAAPIGVAQ